MKPIFKAVVFLLYWGIGYFVVGKAVDYSLWGLLWAVPMGVFVGASWCAIDMSTVQEQA